MTFEWLERLKNTIKLDNYGTITCTKGLDPFFEEV